MVCLLWGILFVFMLSYLTEKCNTGNGYFQKNLYAEKYVDILHEKSVCFGGFLDMYICICYNGTEESPENVKNTNPNC